MNDDHKISVFMHAKAANPCGEMSIEDLFSEIRDGAHRAQIEVIRAEQDEDEQNELKKHLKAVTLSGRVTSGGRGKAMQESRFAHSGFLQIDCDADDLNGSSPSDFRDDLIEDQHIITAFISPRGNGVKAVMLVPPAATEEEHKAIFAAAECYMLETYEKKIDTSTKDSNRLCFVSYDPDARWNSEAVPLDTSRSYDVPPPRPAAPKTSKTSTSSKVGANVGFPPPPHNGIHTWLMEAAWHCRFNGLDEQATTTKLQAYDGTLRRPYDPNEVRDAVRKVYDSPMPEAGTRTAPIDTMNGKPAIELPCPGRPLSDFAADVGKMLAGAGVYSRGGLAFTVDLATKQLCQVDPQWLRTWAEMEISLFKQAKTSAGLSLTLRHSMSLDVAKALVVSSQFLEPLPKIKKFAPVRMPVMRADGRIELLENGFDAETLTLTDPNGCAYPCDRAAADGAKAIRGLLAEFPFADERSKAAAVSAMLTVYAGGLLPYAATNPSFIYLANAEGSGKTTIAQLAGIPYGVCEAESKPATEEEWQKALLALTMSGNRLLLLDNLKGHLNSPSLEAYLTATKFSGRILGVNKKFSGDADAVILMTGNRLTVSPDLRRRCIFIELFMQELRAEDRVFKRRLDAPAIMELQPDILSALWCMVKGWDQAGRPPASKINSSVSRWSEIIAGIVEWAGFACPSGPADIEDGGDTDTRDIAKLAQIMELGQSLKFSELGALCALNGLFERFSGDINYDGAEGNKARKGLSGAFKTYGGRMIATNRRFMIEGKGHQRRYVLK